jgi:hypothetical protein
LDTGTTTIRNDRLLLSSAGSWPAKLVLAAMAIYPERAELLREYPELQPEDVSQALEFAARNLDDQVLPVAAA